MDRRPSKLLQHKGYIKDLRIEGNTEIFCRWNTIRRSNMDIIPSTDNLPQEECNLQGFYERRTPVDL